MRVTRARAVADTSMTTHLDKPDGLSSSLLHIDVPTGHTQPARVTPPYTAQRIHDLLSRAACDEAGARAAVRAALCGVDILDYHVYNFVSELRKLKVAPAAGRTGPCSACDALPPRGRHPWAAGR